MEDKPMKTTYEDLRQMALEDYDRAAAKDHHFNSMIPDAINEYYDKRILTERQFREFPKLVKWVAIIFLFLFFITWIIVRYKS